MFFEMLYIIVCWPSVILMYVSCIVFSLLLSRPTNIYVVHLLVWIIINCTRCTVHTLNPYQVSPNLSKKTSNNPVVIHILCSWNTLVCVEDKICFLYCHKMMAGLWYWVASLYKSCKWFVFNYQSILRICCVTYFNFMNI